MSLNKRNYHPKNAIEIHYSKNKRHFNSLLHVTEYSRTRQLLYN